MLGFRGGMLVAAAALVGLVACDADERPVTDDDGGSGSSTEARDPSEPLTAPVLRTYKNGKVVEIKADEAKGEADEERGYGAGRTRSEKAAATAAADAAPPAASPAPGRASGSGAFQGIQSGEWDDNANYRDFVRYLGNVAPKTQALDITQRRFLVVRDSDGKPVPNCKVQVAQGEKSLELTTTSSGRALFFPRAEGFELGSFNVSASCGPSPNLSFEVTEARPDGMISIDLSAPRTLGDDRVVDLVFVLDTTGSMSEEITALARTIEEVTKMLELEKVSVRLGLVEFKDRGDSHVTRTTRMTRDVKGFLERVREVRASGGGDTPEDVNEGVRVALEHLEWSQQSVARLAFVIGDAPPHLDYQDTTSYAASARRASHEGIVLYTVAASGMDDVGQSVFRQMAQLTGGSSLFVMRGGAGPDSVGGGDPASSCGGTHASFRSGELHRLITNKVYAALKDADGDALKIAGLGKDEDAKPCAERVVKAQWEPKK